MDKLQKHDYMNQIEEYLEVNQVYELFEDLLKQLVVKRPEKPLEFIMQALQNTKRKQGNISFVLARRVFFLGAPECNKNENAMAIADYFSWKCILTGDLL